MLSLDKELRDIAILVADDEPDNLATLNMAIEYLGGTCHCASNGLEVMALLDAITPNLILLDLSMPLMDGWETLKAIRSRPELDYVPVIALTAHAMTGDREKVLAANFTGYIAKPFRPSEIISEIRRSLTPMA